MAVELLPFIIRHSPWEGPRWCLTPFALDWPHQLMPPTAQREAATRHRFRMRVRLGDCLGRHVFVRGEYEPATPLVIRELLGKGDTFADVGPNAGYFTLLASRTVGPIGRVHAFEPVPVTYAEFLVNLSLNNANNVHIYQLALSNTSGQHSVSVGPSDPRGTSSLRNLDEASEPIAATTSRFHEVFPCDLEVCPVTIDIEAVEMLYLEGMIESLRRAFFDLTVEVTDAFLHSMGYSAIGLCRLLADLGCRMYAIVHAGLKPFVSHQADSWTQYNALFTHREQLPETLSVLTSYNSSQLASKSAEVA